MDGRGSDCVMDSELYQYFFATEYVDMFPPTNNDILLQSILVWIGSQKLTYEGCGNIESIISACQADDLLPRERDMSFSYISSRETRLWLK